jgi:hypothetical protein
MNNNIFSLEKLYDELRTCNSYDAILELEHLKDLEKFVRLFEIDDLNICAKMQTWIITLLSYGVFKADSINVSLCKQNFSKSSMDKLFMFSEEVFNTSILLSKDSAYGKRFSQNSQTIKIELHNLIELANSGLFSSFFKVLQVIPDIHPSVNIDSYIDVVVTYLLALSNKHINGMLLIDVLNDVVDIDDDIIRYMTCIISENFNSPESEALDNLYNHFDIFLTLVNVLGNNQADLPRFFDTIDTINAAFLEPDNTRSAFFTKVMKDYK